jgi:hypothetical protein
MVVVEDSRTRKLSNRNTNIRIEWPEKSDR